MYPSKPRWRSHGLTDTSLQRRKSPTRTWVSVCSTKRPTTCTPRRRLFSCFFVLPLHGFGVFTNQSIIQDGGGAISCGRQCASNGVHAGRVRDLGQLIDSELKAKFQAMSWSAVTCCGMPRELE